MSLRFLVAALIGSLLAGCATDDTRSRAIRGGEGIPEYQALVKQSVQSMEKALSALDRVTTATVPLSPRTVARFSSRIVSLQAESLKVRARSQALQTRGDAFFQHWEESIVSVKDSRIRELAVRHRPQLQEHFTHIKAASQTTEQSFRNFLAGLRQLQVQLESNHARALPPRLVEETRDHGKEVIKSLQAVSRELNDMQALVSPSHYPTPP